MDDCDTGRRQHGEHLGLNGNSVPNAIAWHWAGDQVILKCNFTFSCVTDVVFMTMFHDYTNTTLPDCYFVFGKLKDMSWFLADKCHLPACWLNLVIAAFTHNIISNFSCHWGHIKSDVCVNHLWSSVSLLQHECAGGRDFSYVTEPRFFFLTRLLKIRSEQPDSHEHSCRHEECSFSPSCLFNRWVFLLSFPLLI